MIWFREHRLPPLLILRYVAPVFVRRDALFHSKPRPLLPTIRMRVMKCGSAVQRYRLTFARNGEEPRTQMVRVGPTQLQTKPIAWTSDGFGTRVLRTPFAGKTVSTRVVRTINGDSGITVRIANGSFLTASVTTVTRRQSSLTLQGMDMT